MSWTLVGLPCRSRAGLVAVRATFAVRRGADVRWRGSVPAPVGRSPRCVRAYAGSARSGAERQSRVVTARQLHDARLAKARQEVDEHNRSVDVFAAGLRERKQDAVARYLGMVLAAVPLPSDFPRKAEVTYNPHGEQAVVRFELSRPNVVPAVRAVQFVQTKDELRELPRPPKETGELYRLVVSQVALLCLRDVLDADPAIQAVAFNGHVWATNPATGRREYPA